MEIAGGDHAVVLVCKVEDDVLIDDFSYEEALRLLPLPLQAQVHAKKMIHDQYIALANRLLQLCVSRIECGRDEVQFVPGKYGKPYLEDSHASFSMSNGTRYVCMFVMKTGESVTVSDVGIDIASKKDFTCVNDLEVYREVLSDYEHASIENESSLDNMKSRFAFYWSLKECYAKFLGVGLNMDLKTIDGSKLTLPSTEEVENNINNLVFRSFWVNTQEIISYCYPKVSTGKIEPIILQLTISDIIKYMKKT